MTYTRDGGGAQKTGMKGWERGNKLFEEIVRSPLHVKKDILGADDADHSA